MFRVPTFQAPIIARPEVCVVGGGAAGLSWTICGPHSS